MLRFQPFSPTVPAVEIFGSVRICPLANLENFTMNDIWIKASSKAPTGVEVSQLPEFTDGSGKMVCISGLR